MKKQILFCSIYLIFILAGCVPDSVKENADSNSSSNHDTAFAASSKKAAEQGDARAQYNLGMLYIAGKEGVTKNDQ